MSLRRWSARLVVAACVAAVLGVGLVGLLALMMPPNTLTIRLSLLSHLPSVVAIAIIIDLLIAGVAVSGVLVKGVALPVGVRTGWRWIAAVLVAIPAIALGIVPLTGPHVTISPRDLGGDNVILVLVSDSGVLVPWVAMAVGLIVALTKCRRRDDV